MNPFARISLLLGALILVVFGIVCLKHRISPTPVPPAFVPSDPGAISGERRARAEPTILSPDPATDREFPGNPTLRDGSPVPFETPVNTQVPAPIPLSPEPPTDQPSPPAGRKPPAPAQNDVLSTRPVPSLPTSPFPSTDAPLPSPSTPAPIQDAFVAPAAAHMNLAELPRLGSPMESIPAAETDTGDTAPLGQVQTAENDSFWLIATRAYGRGDYHRALYMANRDRVNAVDRLPAGITLVVPPVESLRSQFPDLCPRLSFTAIGAK